MTQKQKQRRKDKVKQYVGLIGGFLGAIFLALKQVGIRFDWFNPESIEAWLNVLSTGAPLLFIGYGLYKNTFIITDKAKRQEKELEKQGLK